MVENGHYVRHFRAAQRQAAQSPTYRLQFRGVKSADADWIGKRAQVLERSWRRRRCQTRVLTRDARKRQALANLNTPDGDPCSFYALSNFQYLQKIKTLSAARRKQRSLSRMAGCTCGMSTWTLRLRLSWIWRSPCPMTRGKEQPGF